MPHRNALSSQAIILVLRDQQATPETPAWHDHDPEAVWLKAPLTIIQDLVSLISNGKPC